MNKLSVRKFPFVGTIEERKRWLMGRKSLHLSQSVHKCEENKYNITNTTKYNFINVGFFLSLLISEKKKCNITNTTNYSFINVGLSSSYARRTYN